MNTLLLYIIIIVSLSSCEGNKKPAENIDVNSEQNVEAEKEKSDTENKNDLKKETNEIKETKIKPNFKNYSVKEMESFLIQHGDKFPVICYPGIGGHLEAYKLNNNQMFIVRTQWGYIKGWGIVDSLPENRPKKGSVKRLKALIVNDSKGVDWEKAKEDYMSKIKNK